VRQLAVIEGTEASKADKKHFEDARKRREDKERDGS
jgi:hypothetical protein